jgi:serine/threonine-protein kinase
MNRDDLGRSPIPPELPRAGDCFADYRLLDVIGRGGMSVVYRAESLALGNVVALKLLAPELVADRAFRERFERESRVAASLNHPSIVPVHGAGEANGLLYIAMRYVEGTDLSALVRERGPLEVERCLAIGTQVASALDAAHARALVHRDVKPGNILVEQPAATYAPEHAYLADFGLTKHAASTSGLTRTGAFIGTIDYMSPEQIADRPVDGRSDVYALGCVLYQCLTGTVPFSRETDAAVLWSHLTDPPPRVTAAMPTLPDRIDEVIARALAKDPAERHGTAGELVMAARDALRSRSTATVARSIEEPPAPAAVPSAPADPGETSSDRSRHPRSRRVRAALVAVALAALLGGGGTAGGVLLSGGDASATSPSGPATTVEAVAPSAPEPSAASTNEEDSGTGSTDDGSGSGGGMEEGEHGAGEAAPAGLAAVIPPPIFEHCQPATAPPAMATDAVDCMPPARADRLDVATYGSLAHATAAYEEIVADAHLARASGRCGATAWSGERPWSHEGHAMDSADGHFVCYFKGGDAHIAWIVESSKLVATASVEGKDHTELYRWWHFWHHQFV